MTQKPLLTVLNYSAGTQSQWLLNAVLEGVIPRPENFAVINADPGMENSESYEFVRESTARCEAAGIEIVAPVSGPNLLDDAINNKDLERWDQPPFWTKNDDGSVGRLAQCCTREYKIRPMDREIRRLLYRKWGIPNGPPGDHMLRENGVVKWIGFAADERSRIKEAEQRYITFQYPLIDLGMDREEIDADYERRGWKKPPRSVCNQCPFNGLATLKDMYENRPADWAKSVDGDNAIRDLSHIGVKQECYVSQTLVPLEDLPGMNFKPAEGSGDHEDRETCDSGYCFT